MPISQLLNRRRSLTQIAFLFAVGIFMAATGATAYRWSEQAGMAELGVAAQHRLDLVAAAIDGVVNRFAHVPSTVLLNPDVKAMLLEPQIAEMRAGMNQYLERLNKSIGSIAIFVINREGITLASSNWNRVDSFVGENLSFRPYFQLAAEGIPARYFAIGTTTGEPGYYVSHPIDDHGKIIGVAVIKIALSSLEKNWLPAETPAFIADGNGVIILTSAPQWWLKAVAPLDTDMLAEIERTRQYNRMPLSSFPVALDRAALSQTVHFPREAKVGNRNDYLALTRRLPDTGWSLTLFSDLTPVYSQAFIAVALAETATASILLALLFLNMRRRNIRQRLEAHAMLERANAGLERKVAERTSDLVETNKRLREEVRERERAEQTLRAAQDELVQAAKLAVLGQLATGITHELAQPLGALRTLSDNAVEYMHRGDQVTLEKNLSIISNLVDRMGSMIGPLKSFARKSPAKLQAVDVNQSITNALFLLNRRVRRLDLTVDNRCEPGLLAWCEPIRLEQVLVNLIGNAIDAMAAMPEQTLTIEALREAPGVVIRVADTGIGLPAEPAERLFEPFYTTKPPGEGLGLGLAISRDIISDFGGRLFARNRPEKGAEFIVELPLPPH